jgi:uncharacterized membrane protein
MFSWKKEHFLSIEERDTILNAIQKAEQGTSGEIRLYIESRCSLVDTLSYAEGVFHELKMTETTDRNASLIYIAYKDKEFAIYGDKAAWDKFPKKFWKEEARKLTYHFYKNEKVKGILHAIENLAKHYQEHFPDHGQSKNELPDEIVFGK